MNYTKVTERMQTIIREREKIQAIPKLQPADLERDEDLALEFEGLDALLKNEEASRQATIDNGTEYLADGTLSPTLTSALPVNQSPREPGAAPTFSSVFRKRVPNEPIEKRDAFWRAVLAPGGIQAFQSTTTDSQGGVALNVSIEAGVLDTAMENSIVLGNGANVIPMNSEKARVWGFDGSTVSGGSLSGASAQWRAEGSAFTASTLQTKKIELTARKLGLFVEETREIMESGEGFSQALERRMGESLAWWADDAFLFGDGVNGPQGALAAANPARILVSRGGGNLIASVDIIGMVERMHPSLFDTAVWITSPSTLDQLTKAHVAGTNSDSFLFAPSQGSGAPNTLMGRPIILSEKSPTLGTAADLALVSFKAYTVGIRQGLRIDVSSDIKFYEQIVVVAATSRLDGQSSMLSAFQPKDSTHATLSWSVVLDA